MNPVGSSSASRAGRSLSSAALDRLAVAACVPLRLCSWNAIQRCGWIAGHLFSLADRPKRGRMEENLGGLGRGGDRRLQRACWSHAARSYLEVLWLCAGGRSVRRPPLRVEGLDALSAAAAAGRGVLLVSAHLGSWELVSLEAARRGARLAVVARPLRARRIERRLVELRRGAGVRTLLRDRPGSSVAAYRWLARGGVLGCMVDRASSGRRLLVPFLGRGTHVPLGPALLACRAGSAVVVGTSQREPDGTIVLRYRRLPVEGGVSAERLARVMAEAIEEPIRSTPEQWLWIYRSQPERPGAGACQRGRVPA